MNTISLICISSWGFWVAVFFSDVNSTVILILTLILSHGAVKIGKVLAIAFSF